MSSTRCWPRQRICRPDGYVVSSRQRAQPPTQPTSSCAARRRPRSAAWIAHVCCPTGWRACTPSCRPSRRHSSIERSMLRRGRRRRPATRAPWISSAPTPWRSWGPQQSRPGGSVRAGVRTWTMPWRVPPGRPQAQTVTVTVTSCCQHDATVEAWRRLKNDRRRHSPRRLQQCRQGTRRLLIRHRLTRGRAAWAGRDRHRHHRTFRIGHQQVRPSAVRPSDALATSTAIGVHLQGRGPTSGA